MCVYCYVLSFGVGRREGLFYSKNMYGCLSVKVVTGVNDYYV